MERWILRSVIVIALSAATGQAHHVLSSIYDSSRQVTIEGVVTQFQFINPHPFLLIEVKGASGSAEQWRLEMDNRSELAQIGVTGETLKKGDRVVVTGSAARVQSPSLYIRRLDRPADGFWY